LRLFSKKRNSNATFSFVQRLLFSNRKIERMIIMLKKMKLSRLMMYATMLVLVLSFVVPGMALAEEVEEPFAPFMVTSMPVECLPPVDPPAVEDGESGSSEGSEPATIDNVAIDSVVEENEVKPDSIDEPTDKPSEECINYMYDTPPTVECEEGQDPCIQPYYRTTTVGEDGDMIKTTLAVNDEDADASNTESMEVTDVEADAEALAAQSGLAEATEMQETRALSVTAMPKTGHGGDAINYTWMVAVSLVALLVAVTMYRRRQQS
jgi:hypothetical protein